MSVCRVMIQGHVELSTEVTGHAKWTTEIWMVFIRGGIRTPQKGRKQKGSEQEEGNLRSPSKGRERKEVVKVSKFSLSVRNQELD